MANLIKDEQLSDIKYIQMHLDTVFKDEEVYKKAQVKCIKKNLEFQLNNNSDYRKYFEQFFEVNDFMGKDNFDTYSIPLLPSSIFKRNMNLASVEETEIIKNCTSSGTRGSLSIIPRDNESLMNFFTSITSILSSMDNIVYPGKYRVFILGPSPNLAGDLWFAYAIASLALVYNTEFIQDKDGYHIDHLAEKIQEISQSNQEVLIIGPPPRVVDLCNYMNEHNIEAKLNGDSFVITAGGWKRRHNESISKPEYLDLVSKTLQINDSNIRDCYNMVELNTVVAECEHHHIHIFPWIDVCARDPRTNEVLEDGQVGILAFYDGSARSYPGFILSEDYGIVHSGQCECGRIGKRIQILRRMETVEARGCALKMSTGKELMQDQEGKNRFYKSFYRNPELFLKK